MEEIRIRIADISEKPLKKEKKPLRISSQAKTALMFMIYFFMLEVLNDVLSAIGFPFIDHIYEVITVLLPMLLIAVLFRVDIRKRLKWREIGILALLILTVIYYAGTSLTSVVAEITQAVFGNAGVNPVVDSDSQTVSFILSMIETALLPAFCEEIVMRGMLLDLDDARSIHSIAFTNGLMFGLFHVGYNQVFYTFVLGTILAYVVLITRSLKASIFIHFLNNGIIVLFHFIPQNLGEKEEISTIYNAWGNVLDLGNLPVYGLVCLVCTAVLLIILARHWGYDDKKRRSTPVACKDHALRTHESVLVRWIPILVVLGYVVYRNAVYLQYVGWF